MNFSELQDRVSFVINFNDGQTDQDFTTARVKQAINLAYTREVNKAEAEGQRKYVKATRTFTWPSSQTTFDINDIGLRHRGLIRAVDVTNTDPGYSLIFDGTGFSGDIFWKDKDTMQWGTSGPGSDRTIRMEYFPIAENLVEDDDEPSLIPEQFHELLVWSTSVFLLTVADQMAPPAWQSERDAFRIDFWKFLARGRPMDDMPTISNVHPDGQANYIYY